MIVVDDGLATGSTMRAAVAAVRRQRPGAADRCGAGRRRATPASCSAGRSTRWSARCTPDPFRAVHQGYRDFTQTPDDEVLALLRTASRTGVTDAAAHSATVPSSRQPGTVSRPSTVNRPSDGR